MKNELKVLDWDTKYFGNKIANLTIGELNPTSLDSILEKAESSGVECIYSLLSPNEKNKIEYVEQAGFHLVDIRMTYSFDLKSYNGQPQRNVSVARDTDTEELVKIARNAFSVSRFLSDPNFRRDKAKMLYVEWLHKNLKSKSPIFITKKEGHISGFLSTEKQGSMGKIGLVATSEQYRGTGEGKQLVEKTLEYFYELECETCEVVTQAENLAAMRLYEKCGFQISKVELWFHKWFKQKRHMAA